MNGNYSNFPGHGLGALQLRFSTQWTTEIEVRYEQSGGEVEQVLWGTCLGVWKIPVKGSNAFQDSHALGCDEWAGHKLGENDELLLLCTWIVRRRTGKLSRIASMGLYLRKNLRRKRILSYLDYLRLVLWKELGRLAKNSENKGNNALPLLSWDSNRWPKVRYHSLSVITDFGSRFCHADCCLEVAYEYQAFEILGTA